MDSVNNRTNGSINTGEATEVVHNALANNGKFTLITAQQLAVAKQQLFTLSTSRTLPALAPLACNILPTIGCTAPFQS